MICDKSLCRSASTWHYHLSILTLLVAIAKVASVDDDYNLQHNDGSYEFGYNAPNSYHHSQANRNNVVRGEFGGRNPSTGGVDRVTYTAGPRGYRPRGSNIVRKYDQNQNGPRAIGSRDDPYFDPNEDPSYQFGFKTRTYSRQEAANRYGDVNGKYTYVDDVGEKHDVEYIAGKNTGFHVKTPFPDSNPRAYGPLFFNGRGKPIPRGRTSIQRGLDGSYRFVSAGPDQRRTETSDALGNVRGSYTYLDDVGVQHSVHYIAGPGIGYRVLKNVKGPHLPTVFPFAGPGIVPPDFYDYLDKASNDPNSIGGGDVFESAASGRPLPPRPPASSGRPGGSSSSRPGGSSSSRPGGGTSSSGANKPGFFDDDDLDQDLDKDIFGDGDSGGGGSRPKPSGPGGRPTTSRPPSDDDGSSSSSSGGGDDPFGGTSSINNNDDDDDLNVFGDDGGGSRPTQRPTQTGGGSSRPGIDSTTYRPSNRPTTSRPRPGSSSRPGGGRPGLFGDDQDADLGGDDFGGDGDLFSPTTRPPTIQIGVHRPWYFGSGDKQHTLVTNLGDTTFSVPPGVSIRAHVQTIDLYPYESKVPSPSAQLRAEMSAVSEQKVEASDSVTVEVRATTPAGVLSTTTSIPSTTTEAQSSSTNPSSTTPKSRSRNRSRGTTTLESTTVDEFDDIF